MPPPPPTPSTPSPNPAAAISSPTSLVQERPVGDIVASLGLEQPSVSKHLRVLREVGLVRVRRDGRQMLYQTNADAIKPLHDWTSKFERFWDHQLLRIKERAEREASDVWQSHTKEKS